MTIERLRPEDARSVSDLIGSALRLSCKGDYPERVLEALAGKHTPQYILERANCTHFYVAREDGAVVGCGAVAPHPGRENACALTTVFVRPDCQGRGIGRRILSVLERDEFALSSNRIVLRASITGLAFYRKLGYRFAGGNETPDDDGLYGLEKLLPGGYPLLGLIADRHSYRGAYRPEPVPREHLRAILEAGLAAPSGCNKQTVSLIAVDEPELLQKLRAVIDPPVGETAPAVICVLSRHINAYRDRCFAVQDYAAAIDNMLLAIVSLGYQSCWYEGHITDADRIGEKMARILGVPEDFELVCFLPVGIAESKPVPPKKKPFEERAWFNGYGQR